MGVLVHVEAVAKPGCLEDLIRACREGFPHTRAFDGCQEIQAYLHEAEETLVVIEHWDSKEHYERYLAWRTETGAMDALNALLQAPMTTRFFTAIDA